MKTYLIAIGLLAGLTAITWSKSSPPEKPKPIVPEEKSIVPGDKPIFIPVRAEKPKYALEIPEPVIDDDENTKEETLSAALKENEGFQKVAEIENVSCEGKTCTLVATAHGDTNEDILNSIIQFLIKNPEYGMRFSKDDIKDDPRAAVITISQE